MMTTEEEAYFFVLGTGRCGSKTLAHYISSFPECSLVHEQPPMLLPETVAYLTKAMSEEDLVSLLHKTRNRETLGGTRLSGESNQRLSFVLPALHKGFPNAKYVWLIRDGRDCVASMFHRNWYHPKEAEMREPWHRPSAENRITAPMMGEGNPAEWDSLSTFEKCCWYWAFTNRHIPKQAKALALPLLQIKLERLAEESEQLISFLGLEDLPRPAVPKSNTAVHGQPLSWHQWTAEQRAQFENLTGAEMDAFYPSWRDDFANAAPPKTALPMQVYGAKQLAKGVVQRIRKLRRKL